MTVYRTNINKGPLTFMAGNRTEEKSFAYQRLQSQFFLYPTSNTNISIFLYPCTPDRIFDKKIVFNCQMLH